LDLGAVNGATLDAKLAMAEVVLRGVDRANRRRLGLPEETAHTRDGQRNPDEPPRWHSQPLPPSSRQDTPIAPNGAERPPAASPVTFSPAGVGPVTSSPVSADSVSAHPAAIGLDADGDEPYVRIIPAGPKTEHRTD
jgi:hypothetical protein